MTTQRQDPQIVTATRRQVVGTAGDYTMDTRHTIPAQWQAYFAAGHVVGNAVPGAMFGVSFKPDSDGGFRYVVGVQVDPVPNDLPEGCCAVTLAGGKHAVLRAFGQMAELPQSFDSLFTDWLPHSDYRQRAGPVFERYPDDPRNGPQGMAYEIWLPVAKRARRKA